MGEIDGPRHYQGAGLGQPTAWICPGCGTQHTTRLEDGCAVCLAEDARRDKSIAGAITDVMALADKVVEKAPDPYSMREMLQALFYTEVARQSLAAALAHFVEHGSPDAALLPKAVMIGWARELAGLTE